MDASPSPPPEPFSPNDSVAVNPTAETHPTQQSDCLKRTAVTVGNKSKTKKRSDAVNSASSSSSSSSAAATSFSRFSTQIKRRIRVLSRTPRSVVLLDRQSKDSDVEALALPLGMSIAAVVAQVLERKDGQGDKMSVDQLSLICSLAVRESLNNVFGQKFDGFVRNFEKSFRSTLLTLRLVNESSQISTTEPSKSQTTVLSCSEVNPPSTLTEHEDNASSFCQESCELESLLQSNSMNIRPIPLEVAEDQSRSRQLILHHMKEEQQLACTSSSKNTLGSAIRESVFSTLEKSVVEQARSNELKRYEIGLMTRKLQLKERQLDLSTDANFLERCKISMGFSKASFKAEKFKTHLEDTRHAELLKNCIDCLVAGLFIMLVCLAYGTYIYSFDRITEATSSCMPTMGSKSWWMPKQMASFSSGFQILRCQVQVISRMLFGLLMIFAIAYLLIHRSSSTNQTMPVTFIILLLGVFCGTVGKFCIDTLGGSGYHWLLYWEALCLLHFLSNVWTSVLYDILFGRINVMEGVKSSSRSGYLVRRIFFYMVMLVFLPTLCGLIPFASFGEWSSHFSSLVASTYN